MQSEFINVELDQIRYSLVWEDANTFYNSLQIEKNDNLLVITSAGCNVLNALLKSPFALTAIDLNPVQNKLLNLKKHIILHHSYSCFRGILGFDGIAQVAKSWKEISKTLKEQEKKYWDSFFKNNPDGILTSGKLEKYISGFRNTCDKATIAQLKALLEFSTVDEQKNYFVEHLHNSSFKDHFIQYFDDANLSKGRDPKLFKHAKESGGNTFYKRLLLQVSEILVKNNFFFNFFFFGPTGLDESILPPCYQEKNYFTLRENLHKLIIVEGEAIDYLLSDKGRCITKASLSNIFEYTSSSEFNRVYQKLFNQKSLLKRVIFWNLLNDQGNIKKHTLIDNDLASKSFSAKTSCFYFKNTKIIDTQAIKEKTLAQQVHAV